MKGLALAVGFVLVVIIAASWVASHHDCPRGSVSAAGIARCL